MSASDKILYPNQLKPCTEDLRDEELIRRLKVCEKFVVVFALYLIFFVSVKALSLTLQAMGQDDENFSRYTPLAVHLVKDFFLSHDSKDLLPEARRAGTIAKVPSSTVVITVCGTS